MASTLYAPYRRLRGARPGVRWDRVMLPALPRKRAHKEYGPAIVASRKAALAGDPRATYDYKLAPVPNPNQE